MSKNLFIGAGTALAMSFCGYSAIDWEAQERLIEMQVAARADFVAPCGTTGEAPTLSHEEHDQVVAFTVKKIKGRIPVLAGTGSNSTDEAERLTEAAKTAGADGALVVMPYYNKPTIEGLRRHYRMIAKVGLPVILYDIPSRCGGKPAPAELILELANEGTICGLKWASGDRKQLKAVLASRPSDFVVLSGDDNLTLEVMCMGGNGVISVVSNLVPEWIVKFVNNLVNEDWKRAELQHHHLLPLMEAMFLETNPIPVKTALAMVYPKIFLEIFRLPLCEMEEANKAKLKEVLRDYGLIQNRN